MNIGSFLGTLGGGLAGGLLGGSGANGIMGALGGGGLGYLLQQLLGHHGGGGQQSAPVAAQTPVQPPASSDPLAAQPFNYGQRTGPNPQDAARAALMGGDSMSGLGVGLGSLLGRLGVRL